MRHLEILRVWIEIKRNYSDTEARQREKKGEKERKREREKKR